MITTNVCSYDLSYINFPSFRLENLFSFVVKRMEIIYHIWDTNSERHKSLVSDKKGTAVKACRRNGKHHWINDPNIKTNIIQKDNILFNKTNVLHKRQLQSKYNQTHLQITIKIVKYTFYLHFVGLPPENKVSNLVKWGSQLRNLRKWTSGGADLDKYCEMCKGLVRPASYLPN